MIDTMDFQLWSVFLIILAVVGLGFIATLGGILVIVFRVAKSITSAIDVMTSYTQKLKKAPDVACKREIIAEISEVDIFVEISEQYENMKIAKKSLIKRHKD